MADEDTSAARHRAANMLWFEKAGLDDALAEALYAFDDDADNRPLYPDAIPTLSALQALGVKVGVVSDIHLDLRLLLAQQGAAQFVDAYVLSFEHNCQKPDPRMFATALQLLDVAAPRTLMVGDRAAHDGGAADIGIATLILPPPPAVVGRPRSRCGDADGGRALTGPRVPLTSWRTGSMQRRSSRRPSANDSVAGSSTVRSCSSPRSRRCRPRPRRRRAADDGVHDRRALRDRRHRTFGRTVGKRVAGTRVVSESVSGHLEPTQAVVRFLTYGGGVFALTALDPRCSPPRSNCSTSNRRP